MRKQLSLMTAATLALGSFGLISTTPAWAQEQTETERQAQQQQQQQRQQLQQAAGAPQLPTGIKQTDKDDSEDIRDMLGSATEAAVTNDGFDDLVERFVDADRNRIGPFANENGDKFAVLNGVINQIRNDWRAKYNKDYDLEDHELVFGDQFQNFQIVQGEIENPALLSNWPLPNQAGQFRTGAVEAGGEVRTGERQVEVEVDVKDDDRIDRPDLGALGELGRPSNRPGDRNLEKGRNVAIAHFPDSHNLPAVTASLIHEMPDAWKIDVPDHVTGHKLMTNLQAQLTYFAQGKDQWPADVNEAHRMLAHRVLMAVYDVEDPQHRQQQLPGQLEQGQQQQERLEQEQPQTPDRPE